MSHLLPEACTTPKTRAELHASNESIAAFATRFNTTKERTRCNGSRSHRAHDLHTNLRLLEEAIAIALRRTLPIPSFGVLDCQ